MTVVLETQLTYFRWFNSMESDGNAAGAKAILDYATTNGAKGIMLSGISPLYVS